MALPRPSRLVRAVLDSLPGSAVLRLLEAADDGRPDLLATLTYHRVAPATDLVGAPSLVSASPSAFEEQVAYLARRFRVVGLDDVLEARERRRPIGRRAVLLTFDDAHRDFGAYAWPILRRHRLPATLFVPTAYPDAPEATLWWDWLYEALAHAPEGTVLELPGGSVRLTGPTGRADAFRRVRNEVKRRPHDEGMALVREIAGERLTTEPPRGTVHGWDELRALAADGVTLAPHSRTHPLLDRIEVDRLDAEIAGSREDLAREIGAAPPAFAYPSGATSPAVREAVARAGMQVAFTTQRGLSRLGVTDWLALRRINVGGSTSLNVLRAQLGRWSLAWS